MGFTEKRVLEMAESLAADFTFSSKRGPYVYYDPAVEAIKELEKGISKEADNETIRAIKEEQKKLEKAKGKETTRRDAPGGLANVFERPAGVKGRLIM